MKKYISIVVTIILAMGIGYILLQNPDSSSQASVRSGVTPSPSSSSSNVTIKDGIQYITVNAKGGYSPKTSVAKWDMPTKLIVKTDNTYDCSSSLVIRSTGYRGMLPATGETAVDLIAPGSGQTIQGVCSMGMYNFNIVFK